MSGDVVEGFRLKPVRRFETTSDPLAEASLCEGGLSAVKDNRFGLWLASCGHTTSADTAVGGSSARPPQLLRRQEFAMDRSHPSPWAPERLMRLQARERESSVSSSDFTLISDSLP